MERSTPGSPRFQQWMTFDEVGAMIQNEEAMTSVTEWLHSNSVIITWKSKRGEYLKASAPISVWEKMFTTEFYEWEDSHRSISEPQHLAEHFSLPEEITPHVDAVFSTVQVPPIVQSATQPQHHDVYKTKLRVDVQSTSTTTVSYINSYYKIQSNLGDMFAGFVSRRLIYSPVGNASLSQAVFEIPDDYFSQEDLETFQSYYGLTEQPAEVIGGHNSSSCTISSCIDGNTHLQYVMGLAQRVATIYW